MCRCGVEQHSTAGAGAGLQAQQLSGPVRSRQAGKQVSQVRPSVRSSQVRSSVRSSQVRHNWMLKRAHCSGNQAN